MDRQDAVDLQADHELGAFESSQRQVVPRLLLAVRIEQVVGFLLKRCERVSSVPKDQCGCQRGSQK